VNDSSFKKDCFVFTGSSGTGGDVTRWQRKECSSFDLSNGNVSMGQEDMELVHEIFGDEIGPSDHVDRVSEDRHEYFATDLIEIVHDNLVNFHENNFILDIILVKNDVIIWIWHFR
jgi:hypothetical protein